MPKIKRAAFSDEEKDLLFAEYGANKYPSMEKRHELSKRLRKPVTQITNWFKNQRAQSGDSKSWVRPSKRTSFRKRVRQEDDEPATPVNEITINSSVCSGNLVIDESFNTMNSSHSEILPKPKQRKLSPHLETSMTIVDIKQENVANICNPTLSLPRPFVPMSTPFHDVTIKDAFAPSPTSTVRYFLLVFIKK